MGYCVGRALRVIALWNAAVLCFHSTGSAGRGPLNTKTTMAGRGKRVQVEDSDQPYASKQQKTAEWCVDCKAAPDHDCRVGHRRLDMDVAEMFVQDKLRAALRKAARHQAHLEAMTDARVLDGPVLVAEVAGVDREDAGWEVSGGEMRIALAATKRLSSKDERAVCAAFEGLEVEYEVEEAACTVARADLCKIARCGVVDKLPYCVEGQAARKGDVILGADGRLSVFFRDTPSRGERGARMFGRVDEDGLDALAGSGCDGRDDYSVRAGWGDDCWTQSSDCFCRNGGPTSTSLSDARVERHDDVNLVSLA